MSAYITLPLLCLTALSAGYTIVVPNVLKMEMQTSDMNRVNQFMSKVDIEKMKELMILEESLLLNKAVHQVAAMDELKQILELLESKGYSMQFLSDVLNTFLVSYLKNTKQTEQHLGSSIEDVMAALAQETCLENSPEVERLLENLNTDEFINMLNKLMEKVKELIEDYATDVRNRVCHFLKIILGDKFSSPLCK